jgi:hypothetical protein
MVNNRMIVITVFPFIIGIKASLFITIKVIFQVYRCNHFAGKKHHTE